MLVSEADETTLKQRWNKLLHDDSIKEKVRYPLGSE
jgi:hypothetical protein